MSLIQAMSNRAHTEQSQIRQPNELGLIMDVPIRSLNQTPNRNLPRSGSVLCVSCGSAFRPDKNRRKFCDHSCYADWRSKRTSFVDRFWSKVNKTAGCWLWTGAVRGGGYGFIAQRRVDGRQVRTMAHRMSWELANGDIPDGLVACHHCDTPACVNPAHLFLGTQKDNIADALTKGRLIGRGRVLQSRSFAAARSHVSESAARQAKAVSPEKRQFETLRSERHA